MVRYGAVIVSSIPLLGGANRTVKSTVTHMPPPLAVDLDPIPMDFPTLPCVTVCLEASKTIGQKREIENAHIQTERRKRKT